MTTDVDRNFGKFVRSLRHARGLTQEGLAERSNLAADTIRRLETGAFSPSLQTLRKFAAGIGLDLSTIFAAFELRDLRADTEILDLLSTRSPRDLALGLQMLVVFFDAIDATTAGSVRELADDDEPADDDEAADDDELPEGES